MLQFAHEHTRDAPLLTPPARVSKIEMYIGAVDSNYTKPLTFRPKNAFMVVGWSVHESTARRGDRAVPGAESVSRGTFGAPKNKVKKGDGGKKCLFKSAASLKCLSLHSSRSERGRSSFSETFRKTFGESETRLTWPQQHTSQKDRHRTLCCSIDLQQLVKKSEIQPK